MEKWLRALGGLLLQLGSPRALWRGWALHRAKVGNGRAAAVLKCSLELWAGVLAARFAVIPEGFSPVLYQREELDQSRAARSSNGRGKTLLLSYAKYADCFLVLKATFHALLQRFEKRHVCFLRVPPYFSPCTQG